MPEAAVVVEPEIKYELTLGEGSSLDAADVTAVTEYAKGKKYTNDQAVELLGQREEAAKAFKARQDAANAAPAEYALKPAEGSPLDAADVEAVTKFAKDNKLTQKQADVILSQRDEGARAFQARNTAQLTAIQTQWAADVKADPEIGGEHEVATLKNTKRVMDRFAPEGSEFRKLLDSTKYGDHPEFVRFINKIGLAMGEDGTVTGGSGGEKKKTGAEQRYANSNMAP